MKKRFLTLAFAIVMLVVVLSAVVSCGDGKHSHSYTKREIAASCTGSEKTVYTCECGDSYVEKGAPAFGHTLTQYEAKPITCTEGGYAAYEACSVCSYTTKVEFEATGHYFVINDFTIPTLKNEGYKSMACRVCNYEVTENLSALDAIGIPIPEFSDILASLIEEISFSLEVFDDSKVVYTSVSSNNRVQNGEKRFYAVELCEAKLFTEDSTPKGYLKIKINESVVALDGTENPANVTAGKYNTLASAYIYLDGSELAVELTNADGDKLENNCNITELLFGRVLGEMGMTTDDAVSLLYFVTEFAECLPGLEEFANAIQEIKLPQFSSELPGEIANLFDLFGEKFFEKTTKADGTVVYTTDITAISVLLDAIKSKNVEEAIDSVYGKGAAEAIELFVISIPDLTIMDIAEFAITASENFGIDVDQIFSIADMMLYYYTGRTISVKYELEKQYNIAIVELVAGGNAGFDRDEFLASAKVEIEAFFEMFYAINLEELIGNVLGAGNTSVFDALLEAAKSWNTAVNLTCTLDGEGNLKSAELNVDGTKIILGVNDGEVALNVITPGNDTMSIVIGSEGMNMNFVSDGTVVAEAYLRVEKSENDVKYSADLVVGDYDYLDFGAEIKNDELISFNFVMRDLVSEYNDYGDNVGSSLSDIFEVNYTRSAISGGFVGSWNAYFEEELYMSSEVIVKGDDFTGKIVVYNVNTHVQAMVIDMSVEGDDSKIDVKIYDRYGALNIAVAIEDTMVDEDNKLVLSLDCYAEGFKTLASKFEYINEELVKGDIVLNTLECDLVYDSYWNEYVYGSYYIDYTTEFKFTKSGDVSTLVIKSTDGVNITITYTDGENSKSVEILGVDENGDVKIDASVSLDEESDGTRAVLDIIVNDIPSAAGEGYTLTDAIEIYLDLLFKI